MARNQWAMTASACSLAECIHYLGAQYHGRAILPWAKLSPREQHEKVEAASRYLAAHPPTKGETFGPDYFEDSEAQAAETQGRVLAFVNNDLSMGGAA